MACLVSYFRKNKFRLFTLIFILVIIAVSSSRALREFETVIISSVVLIYVALVVWGVSDIKINFFLKSINSFPTQKNKIALTFDDGPSEKSEAVLDLLKENNIKATFFLIGKNIALYPNVAKRIVEEGHSIGNHSWSHSSIFPLFFKKAMREDLMKADDEIRETLGIEPKLFRPPFGVTNPTVASVLDWFNYKVIGWSLRSFDTKNESVAKVLNRITTKVKGGDIILLHDTSLNIIEILEELIPWLINKNYEFDTIENLMNQYELDIKDYCKFY